jgi:hypothetical protein
MGWNWLVDWVLRFLQDTYKSGFSLDKAGYFLVTLILIATFIYWQRCFNWIKSAHRKVRQVEELENLETEINNLRRRIYLQLRHLEGQDEEFKEKVEQIIDQVKSLFFERKDADLIEGSLTNEIKSLEVIYGRSLEDIKELVNTLSNDLNDAEKIFMEKESWSKDKAGSIYRKRAKNRNK